MAVFTLITLVGFFYFVASIIGFMLMILCSGAVYLRGLVGIRDIVSRFDLTLPNKRIMCLHFSNMALFILFTALSTATEILMVRLYDNDK